MKVHHNEHLSRSGVAAVEFAMIAPLFLLLLAGIIEFGQAFRIQHSLSVAARRGARASIVEGATTSGVTQKVKSSCSLVLGVDEGDVKVSVAINGSQAADLNQAQLGDEITVLVSVNYADAGVGFYGNLMTNSEITSRCTLEHE